MEKLLSEMGVEWERVPAFDRREFEPGFVEDVYEKSAMVHQDEGSIGSFMTHRACWQRLIDSDEEHALILEDDLVFGVGARRFLTDASWLPQSHWKCIVHLETFGRVTVLDAEPVDKAYAYGLHALHMVHHGSAAYLIHREVAEAALKASSDLNNVPDEFLFMPPPANTVTKLPILQAVPAPFVQEDILERMGGQKSTHRSLVAETRKGNRKGLTKLKMKLRHLLIKRWILLVGLITDGIRGRKTGVIDFK
ncbi:MAG: glycosyltransferase family 25 protein [Pseudomonadota bacterium]